MQAPPHTLAQPGCICSQHCAAVSVLLLLRVEPFSHFVPIAQEVKYLGVFIDAQGSGNSTVSKRFLERCLPKQLKPFLSHKGLPTKWKLIVYKSIILSILGYAMESILFATSSRTKVELHSFSKHEARIWSQIFVFS